MSSILPPFQANTSSFSPDCADLSRHAVPPQGSGRRPGFCGEAAGLVYYETSEKKSTETPRLRHLRLIRVDQKAARLKKMRSSVVTAARLHVESQPSGFRKLRTAFITATYREDVEWKPRHISDLQQRIQKWFKARGHLMRCVWVMELHKSGRPHYHLIVWLPKGLTLPKPDKQCWWPHGSTRIEAAKNPVAYIAKYASKGAENGLTFPPGARIHSTSGLTGLQLLESRWWKLPVWAREQSIPSERLRRCVGGGILNPDTGELFLSPWRVLFKGGAVYIFRVDSPEVEKGQDTILFAC